MNFYEMLFFQKEINHLIDWLLGQTTDRKIAASDSTTVEYL